MDTTTSALALMPLTKKQQEAFSADIVDRVKAGDLDPLELKIKLKAIQDTLSKIDKGIKEDYLTEAYKHEKVFEKLGYKIEQCEAGVKYDYSNDDEWVALNKAVKDREKMLKGLTKPVADIDSGLVICPPIKKSTSTIKLTAI